MIAPTFIEIIYFHSVFHCNKHSISHDYQSTNHGRSSANVVYPMTYILCFLDCTAVTEHGKVVVD